MYHTLDTQTSRKPLFGHPVSKYQLRPWGGWFSCGRSNSKISTFLLTISNHCRSLMRGERLSAVLDEVKVTRSGRELITRSQTMFTAGMSHCLVSTHNSMEWWTSVGQSGLMVFFTWGIMIGIITCMNIQKNQYSEDLLWSYRLMVVTCASILSYS